jgi:hypothetical protein
MSDPNPEPVKCTCDAPDNYAAASRLWSNPHSPECAVFKEFEHRTVCTCGAAALNESFPSRHHPHSLDCPATASVSPRDSDLQSIIDSLRRSLRQLAHELNGVRQDREQLRHRLAMSERARVGLEKALEIRRKFMFPHFTFGRLVIGWMTGGGWMKDKLK